MFCDFKRAFMPSDEDKKKWAATVRKTQEEAVKNKECWMCMFRYHEPWNNHGHNDHTTHCSIDGKCVDFSTGINCTLWLPKEIDIKEDSV